MAEPHYTSTGEAVNERLGSSVVTIVACVALCSCMAGNDGTETSSRSSTAAGESGGDSGGNSTTARKAGSGGVGGKGATAGKDSEDAARTEGKNNSAGSKGTAGSGSAGDASGGDATTTRVAIETFEAPAPFGEWTADNSEQHDGSMSLHSPPIDPKSTASYEYSCDGKEFNHVSFWLNVASRLDGQKLDLKVDGKLYEWFDETFYSAWRPQILTLKRGTHRFTWIASTTNSGEPAFWIDTIECFDTPENENMSGIFGFQDHYVPREITGTFVVDNWRPDTSEPTNLTAHPPVVAPSDKPAYLEFSCGGKPHSKLSFQYATKHLSTGWRLKFFVDDQLKETLAESYGSFDERIIQNGDPSRAPRYKWVAETDVNARPEVWIDDIKCE